MEQYDFRSNAKIATKIGLEFDGMTTKQLQSLKDAIEDIKRAGDRDELVYYSGWFDRVLLPIWKDFASFSQRIISVISQSSILQRRFRVSIVILRFWHRLSKVPFDQSRHIGYNMCGRI